MNIWIKIKNKIKPFSFIINLMRRVKKCARLFEKKNGKNVWNAVIMFATDCVYTRCASKWSIVECVMRRLICPARTNARTNAPLNVNFMATSGKQKHVVQVITTRSGIILLVGLPRSRSARTKSGFSNCIFSVQHFRYHWTYRAHFFSRAQSSNSHFIFQQIFLFPFFFFTLQTNFVGWLYFFFSTFFVCIALSN